MNSIATRSCKTQTTRERIHAYDDRLRNLHDFDHLVHASRVAAGVRKQCELVRLPVPRHRALVVSGPLRRE